MTTEITRREALRRTALLLGGTLSAPTILGVMAGCDRPAVTGAARTLTAEQSELVATIAELIIPETETPGARAARVHEFVDVMLTDHYPAAERDRFLAGLGRVDAAARGACGTRFVECTPEQQTALLRRFDRAAYATGAAAPVAGADALAPAGAEPTDDRIDPGDRGPKAFFRTMKELTLVGYYTSEVGATRELRVMPLGPFRGDIPLGGDAPAWA